MLPTWSLAANLFPTMLPDLGREEYWTMGIAGALGLFASIVLHELAHAKLAQAFGLRDLPQEQWTRRTVGETGSV